MGRETDNKFAYRVCPEAVLIGVVLYSIRRWKAQKGIEDNTLNRSVSIVSYRNYDSGYAQSKV